MGVKRRKAAWRLGGMVPTRWGPSIAAPANSERKAGPWESSRRLATTVQLSARWG